jgi:hypothetical protein
MIRGSAHVIAYARAIERPPGVDVLKPFPVPELSNHRSPECRKYVEQGLYHAMYCFSPKGYRRLAEIGTRPHHDGVPNLVVSDGPMPTQADPPSLAAEPPLGAPVPPTTKRIFG